MFINKEENQLVVAIKNAILFNVPGSKIDQKKVANKETQSVNEHGAHNQYTIKYWLEHSSKSWTHVFLSRFSIEPQ